MYHKKDCVPPESLSEDEKLVRNLRRCAGHLRHHAEEKGSQRRVLHLLRHRGSMTQKEILELLGVRASSLSELLGKLEAKGCILREKSETDKRNQNVTITETGLLALKELDQQYSASITQLLSGFSPEDKATLNSLLDKLHASWKEDE